MLVMVQSPPSTIDAPSAPSSHLSAPGNLGPDVLDSFGCNYYFDTVRSFSAPAVLVTHGKSPVPEHRVMRCAILMLRQTTVSLWAAETG